MNLKPDRSPGWNAGTDYNLRLINTNQTPIVQLSWANRATLNFGRAGCNPVQHPKPEAPMRVGPTYTNLICERCTRFVSYLISSRRRG
jgi:hypothetical protein